MLGYFYPKLLGLDLNLRQGIWGSNILSSLLPDTSPIRSVNDIKTWLVHEIKYNIQDDRYLKVPKDR